jgi:hypothetical protein
MWNRDRGRYERIAAVGWNKNRSTDTGRYIVWIQMTITLCVICLIQSVKEKRSCMAVISIEQVQKGCIH